MKQTSTQFENFPKSGWEFPGKNKNKLSLLFPSSVNGTNSQSSRLKILHSSLNPLLPCTHPFSHSITGKSWQYVSPTFPVKYKPSLGPHDMVLVKTRQGRQPGNSKPRPELELFARVKTHSNAQLFPMPPITCNHSLFGNLCSTCYLSHDTPHSGLRDMWSSFSI